jgi:hypothetical protein
MVVKDIFWLSILLKLIEVKLISGLNLLLLAYDLLLTIGNDLFAVIVDGVITAVYFFL